MEREELESVWERTVPADVRLDDLPTLVTYRADGADGGPEELLETARFTPSQAIGQGGMGVVVRARQESLRRDVAVKTLTARDPGARRNFLAEARVTGYLEHPNIVPVHDLGQNDDGEVFLAMKLVEGRTWEELLDDPEAGDLDFHLEILLQLCNAVGFAHSRGIAHNDLKPSNVLVGAFGEVVLVDWGLAVSFRDHASLGIRHRSSIVDGCGTPAYIAPELALGEGELLGPTTDVYLLGGILCKLLTGRPPHAGKRFYEALAHAISGELPAFDEGLPGALVAACEKALAREQGARFQEVAGFAAAIRDHLRHRESLALAEATGVELEAVRARVLAEGKDPGLYRAFAEVVAGFSQARRLWEANPRALAGERAARALFAETAIARRDFSLADEQLRALEAIGAEAACARLGEELAGARARRRRARLRLQLGAGFAVLLALCSLGFVWLTRSAAVHEERKLRRSELAALQAAVDDARVGLDVRMLEADVEALRAHGVGLDSRIGDEQRQAHLRSIHALLAQAAAEEDWYELAARDLRGSGAPLVAETELAERLQALHRHRQLALRLALALGSFELAEAIAAGTSQRERREEWREQVRTARRAHLAARTTAAAAILDELREARQGWANRLSRERDDFYASWLGSQRSEDFAAFLAARLAPYTARAAVPDAQFSTGERRELRVLLRALGILRLPEHTVGPLRDFLAATSDRRLLLACADALCSLRSPAALRALVDHVLVRFGPQSSIWQAVMPLLPRLPVATMAWDESAWEELATRAIVQLVQQEPELAEADVLRALVLAPEDPDLYQLLTACLHAQERYDAALTAAEDALERFPEVGLLHTARGDALVALGRPNEAIAAYDRALLLDPQDLIAYMRRAALHLDGQRSREALTDLAQAHRIDPFLSDAYLLRSVLFNRRGQSSEALRELYWIALVDGNQVAHWVRLSHQLLLAREVVKARVAWRRGTELVGETRELRRLDVDLLLAEDRPEAALQLCDSLLVETAEARVRLLRARALVRLADEAGATREAEAALELDPSFALAHTFLGHQAFRLGDNAAAYEHFEAALSADRMLADAHFGRGLVLWENQLPEAALQAAGTALALARDHPRALLLRGEVRLALDQPEGALADLDRLLEIDPTSSPALLLRASVFLQFYGEVYWAWRDLDLASELVTWKSGHATVARGLAAVYTRHGEQGGLPSPGALAERIARHVQRALELGATREDFVPGDPTWRALEDGPHGGRIRRLFPD